MASEFRRILVVRWSGLGKTAMSSALFEDLATAYPHAELHLSTKPPLHTLFESDSRFKSIHFSNHQSLSFGAGLAAWLKLLREHQFDLIIDLETSRLSKAYLAAARMSGVAPKTMVGLSKRYPYTHPCGPVHPKVHMFTCLQAPLIGLSVPLKTGVATFEVPDTLQQQAIKLLKRHQVSPGRFAIFIPGSSKQVLEKRWSVDRYTELAERLLKRKFTQIVVLGAEAERDVCEELASSIGHNAINLCGQTSLAMVPCIAARARATVSNSTGLAHVAAAAGTPIWVVFGNERIERCKPLGSHVRGIRADESSNLDTPASVKMASISAEVVAASMFEVLEGDDSRRRTGWL